MPLTRRLLISLVLCAAIVAVAACDVSLTLSEDVEAVGKLVTVPHEVGEFDSIAVENSFEVFVEVGESAFVEVIVNESLVDDLDVRVRNGELKIGLKNGVSVRNGTLEATVQLPQLDGVDVSGASSTTVVGIVGPSLEVDVSGASELLLEGSAQSLTIDGSGASTLDVRLDGVEDVTIDLSGASSLDIEAANRVTGDMSGASDMSLPADAALDVDTSGASEITGR